MFSELFLFSVYFDKNIQKFFNYFKIKANIWNDFYLEIFKGIATKFLLDFSFNGFNLTLLEFLINFVNFLAIVIRSCGIKSTRYFPLTSVKLSKANYL